MTKKIYDIFIIGHISLDELVYKGVSEKMVGGAVIQSSYAASSGGNKVGILTKTSLDDKSFLDSFNIPKDDVYFIASEKTTSIRNEFLSDDKERRTLTCLSIAESFKLEEIPEIQSEIYYLGGLIAGEFEPSLIKELSKLGKVAVDMQGFIRCKQDNILTYKDWDQKKEYLPYIDFLKVDALEAEIMTGYTDRRKAAEKLRNLGAKEVMVTFNTEVLVYDGKQNYTVPFKNRNLSGRTGRGDTCFSAYVTERLKKGIEESLLYAAALTSLKMETPGPFNGTRTDVENYINELYK